MLPCLATHVLKSTDSSVQAASVTGLWLISHSKCFYIVYSFVGMRQGSYRVDNVTRVCSVRCFAPGSSIIGFRSFSTVRSHCDGALEVFEVLLLLQQTYDDAA